MKQTAAIFIAIGLWSCNTQSNPTYPAVTVTEITGHSTSLTQAEIKGLDSINIDFQFRGNCYAYSSPQNAEESNGEAHSDNLPKVVDQSFPKKGFYMVINEKEASRIDSTALGCKLYLVNTTDSLIKLPASDSRLYIVAEALDENNEWASISYLPSSGCGNSQHTVALDKNEYWVFDVPIFKGTIKTKLRYILTIDKDTKIRSNEVVTYLNKGQFDKERKQGHRKRGLMDPYYE